MDTSHVQKATLHGELGPYHRVDYEIVLKVGLTELQAFCAWQEDVGALTVASFMILTTHCIINRVLRSGGYQLLYTCQLIFTSSC